jgi:hypothetical protein
MFNVLLVKVIKGTLTSEWITDADGDCVEFKSEAHAETQFQLLKKSDSTILDYIIE